MTDLPIIAPLLALLRSRKFLVTIASIITNIVIVKLPELAPARDIIVAVISLGALGLVGTIAWEDRAAAARDAATAIDTATLNELVRSAINDVVDTLLKQEPPADVQASQG